MNLPGQCYCGGPAIDGTLKKGTFRRRGSSAQLAQGTITMIDCILDDFFWRALIGGLGVALVAGPLAVLWFGAPLAYFGTHCPFALLGIAPELCDTRCRLMVG